MKRILVGIALLAGCSKNNPGFGFVPEDLSASIDLGAVDEAVPSDLPPGGDLPFSLADLSASDLPSTIVDLARTDALVRCNGVACAGCCANNQCRAFGDQCATAAEVCTAAGCQKCGGADQPCCALLICGAGLICNTGICRSCGGPGQPCCPGSQCAGGGCCTATNLCAASGKRCADAKVCLDGACVSCGGSGAPCCQDWGCESGCCVPSTRTCGAALANCTLSLCGAIGITCCDPGGTVSRPDVCSSGGTVCTAANNGESCLACGHDSQPCCGVNTCLGGCCVDGVCHDSGTSCGSAGMNCLGSSCLNGSCGGPGQVCCANSRCTAPDTRCINNTCNVCGGKDQRCCIDPSSGQNVFCEPPYLPSSENAADAGLICFCRRS